MKHEIKWSNLIIEKGVFDPLGLWRVGDRIIGNLLSPFTTVVTHRPARYFSMYCWMLHFLNNKKFNDTNSFWKQFYSLESLFLCAIRVHENHKYKHFQGQIGTGTAKKNISKIKKGLNKIGKLEKTNNGWESNYKNAMRDFFLIETDFGLTSKIKLTKRGIVLAEAYQKSIRQTQFYRCYDGDELSYEMVEDLAKYSCPCLLYNPDNEMLADESRLIAEIMLTKDQLGGHEDTEGLENILSSTYLILHCLMEMDKNGVPFSKQGWRKVLSTGLFESLTEYQVPDKFKPLFRKWEIYNLDSMFVYALEIGLCGFLEYLHQNNNYLQINKMNVLLEAFDSVCGQYDFFEKYVSVNDIETTVRNLASLRPEERLKVEDEIIKKTTSLKGQHRIISGFFLYLYVQALYYSKFMETEYKETIDFYRDFSDVDGAELTLEKTLDTLLDNPPKKIKDFFLNVYLKKWIVIRQLNTRRNRNKDVAWFSQNNETRTYNWEAAYKPGLYRAPRSEILLTFLLNLNIVEHKNGKWVPGKNINRANNLLS